MIAEFRSNFRRITALFVILAAGLALAACGDQLRMGLPSGPPSLVDDAVVAADGTDLPLRRWLPDDDRPPRAVILALHGYNDHANAFDAAASYWAERGIATYAYDQRGFGRHDSRGIWSSVEALSSDAAAALWLLHDAHPNIPLYLLGHSMGGAVAMTVATGTGSPGLTTPPLDGVILAAPAIWARETMPGYQRLALEIGAMTVPGLRVSPEGLGIVPSDNVEMLRALGRDPLVLKESRVDALDGLVTLMDRAYRSAPDVPTSTLMLYGDREEVVPLDTVDLMLERLEPGRFRLAFYENGYHMLLRDLQAKTVWDDILAWIVTVGGPLPSGADRRGDERHSALVDARSVQTAGPVGRMDTTD